MIWPIATNPILSLLKRSSEKLIHTLLTKFSPSKFSRSSFCLYKSRPKIPFVEYEFLQSQKKKFVIHQTRLQINIFFFFLSFKKEKKNGCRCVDRIQLDSLLQVRLWRMLPSARTLVKNLR